MTNQLINRKKDEISSNKILTKTENVDKNKINSLRLLFSFVLGLIFGYLMNKSKIHLAEIIRDQMLFKCLTMIKMFLCAVGMSMLTVVIVNLINQSIYEKVLKGFIQKNNQINGVNLVVGGLVMGIGMVVAGSCPGTVFVQIGSGLTNSLLTGLGGCCGVLFYYLIIDKYLTKCQLSKSSILLKPLPDLIGIKRLYLNFFFGLLMISLSFGIELKYPYKKDLIKSVGSSLNSWSPSFCGLGIGLLQLVFLLYFEKSLGISTGFSVIVSQGCRIQSLKRLIPSMEKFTYGIENNLTLLFSFGVIIGSFLSTYSNNEFPLNEKYGANPWNSFIGGFLLLVGARCAGGCTSGQGISGVSHLLIGSFIATASIFAGGILFAFTYGFITNDWQFDAL